ncbi:DUF6708 domain-containing protein [Stenotrophomonas maltophilia]|uniref:DUF6708 domain-containing protein n=1 Tax=Stenotrophomonas maltophilia TaxID=40324 RepID=UPI002402BFC1|nr:DUF6708 domain-containing protein [Stenotrophomonas maltophilia]
MRLVKRIDVYTGWLTKFKVDRPLGAVERLERLPRERIEECSERHCVISLNSTYMDVVDRRYRLRGMVGTTVATLVCSAMALFGLWMLIFWVPTARPDGVYDWRVAAVFLLIFVGQWPLVCWLTFGRDFFSYKYYPIRFNRRTRMVHAFVGKGEDGVITVPWDDAYFHLGHGQSERSLRDIRVHVMDGDIVRRTFAVGHYFDDERKVREIWEFIRRYMDEGPEQVIDATAPCRVHLSVADSWKNCYLTVVISLGEALVPWRWVLMPLLLPLVACRWLVLKSSKAPVWPEHVSRESKIDADDPNIWREPEYVGQFYEGDNF